MRQKANIKMYETNVHNALLLAGPEVAAILPELAVRPRAVRCLYLRKQRAYYKTIFSHPVCILLKSKYYEYRIIQ